MANVAKFRGLDKILANIKAKEAKVGLAAERGLFKIANDVWRYALPLTPVDTRNLRGSYDVRKEKGSGFTAQVVLVNTAEYAIYVHEMIAPPESYTRKDGVVTSMPTHRPPTQAKFVETAVRDLQALGIPEWRMMVELKAAKL